MKILYPYNEILPTFKAHDVFLFQECAALSALKQDVLLLCGQGSLPDQDLFFHYNVNLPFPLKRLFTLRKNNPFNLSWNLPFFILTQREIERLRPSVVILSVLKQGIYHLSRRCPGVRYVYEVHELKYYPGYEVNSAVIQEKQMLSRADGIVVTTQALKEILRAAPYNLRNPIEVIPLAVNAQPLPPPSPDALTVAYVGQLYQGQGIELLLKAFALTTLPHLKIIGGKQEEIAKLKAFACKRVEFTGFIPPQHLRTHVQQAHAFVAPFEATGRMPYVAHTKLCDYSRWGRPVIAPDLPVVREHFENQKGCLLFKPGDAHSLAQALNTLQNDKERITLQRECEALKGHFDWDTRAKHYISWLQDLLIVD